MALPLQVQDLDRRSRREAGLAIVLPESRRIISYSKTKKFTPWLMPAIVVVNIIIYIITMFINNCPKTPAGQQGKCIPKFLGRLSYDKTTYGPSEATLLKLGAILGKNIDHEKWKLFVSIWLHKNILHLIVNSISLLIIGIPLEKEFGQVRIGAIYILSGFGGTILYAKVVTEFQAVCAAGPMFGLIGATLSELLTNLLSNDNKSKRFWVAISIIMVNTIGVVRGPPDDILGGFFTGCLLSFLILIRPQYEPRHHQPPQNGLPSQRISRDQYDVLQIVYWLISIILLAILIIGSFVWVIGGFHHS